MLLAGSALKGYAIRAQDGRIGSVHDLLFDDSRWTIRWLVVDTGTWLPGRKVLLHPASVSRADHELREISVALTEAQVRGSPDISEDKPVSLQMQRGLYDYYGWDPMWGGGYFGAGAMASPMSARPFFGGTGMLGADHATALDDADPHLRSLAAVTGYHLQATDGEIGHVENMLVDDAAWDIRYLIADTRNWLAGKQVLIAPFAVVEIVWEDRIIRLNVSRTHIRSSPPWDPTTLIDDAYQAGLHHHYGWPGYGW
jgi:hypothetical protein